MRSVENFVLGYMVRGLESWMNTGWHSDVIEYPYFVTTPIAKKIGSV